MGQFYSLDYSKLDTILKDVKNTTLDYFPYFQEAFILLYETGCRVGELFEITRWRRINDTTLGLTPQKYNSERIIVIPAGVTLFPQWVDNQVVPWFGLSVVQLNALFMRYSPYTSYLAETKPVSLYLFRYRYIRYLASSGWSLADIQTIMGYSSQTVIHNYLNSALSYYAELPPIPVVRFGNLDFMVSNVNLNDGGAGIFPPNGDAGRVSDFGYLYTYSAMSRIVSSYPSFRLLTPQDKISLDSYFGSYSVAGGKLKASGYSYWDSPNTGASDEFGLSLRGSGYRVNGYFGMFKRQAYYSFGSINSLHYFMFLAYNNSSLSFGNNLPVSGDFSLSVRFVRDAV